MHLYAFAAFYRVSSGPVSAGFSTGAAAVFGDLSRVLERAATYSAPIYLVGDFNIRLDRSDDLHALNFRSLLQAFDLIIAATGSTHVRMQWDARRRRLHC